MVRNESAGIQFDPATHRESDTTDHLRRTTTENADIVDLEQERASLLSVELVLNDAHTADPELDDLCIENGTTLWIMESE